MNEFESEQHQSVHKKQSQNRKPTDNNQHLNKAWKDLFQVIIVLIIILSIVVFIIEHNAMMIETTTMIRNIRFPGAEKDCMDQSYYKYPIMFSWTENSFYSSVIHTCDYKTCIVIKKTSSPKCKNLSATTYLFNGLSFNLSDLPLPRKSSDIWVLHHDESPPNLLYSYNDDFMRLFNYSTTYSRYSDVPFPLHHLIEIDHIVSLEYYIKTKHKNKLLKSISPVLYINSHCQTSTERDEYVTELMKYIPIDSYGQCLNNMQMPKNLLQEGPEAFYLHNPIFLSFVSRYKFTIAIENAVCNDYVTEKFWRPIHVGSVPIYFGSPRIRDWMPNNKSAILLTDYPTPVIMANYIKSLLANDTLYEEHLEHKTKGIISNPVLLDGIEKNYHQNPNVYCFVCKKVYEAMNGKIVPKTIDRRHLDCPIPISALSLKVNPENPWVIKAQRIKNGNFAIDNY